MPHPKNRLKLTGDTHLPDVADLIGDDEDIEVAVVAIEAQPLHADGWVAPAQEAIPVEKSSLPEPVMKVERRVERQVASTPWLAIGAALGFGFLVARMLRR